MTSRARLPAFSTVGIELEYMIVDRDTLRVRPIADRLLKAFAGHATSEVRHGTLGWSNELVRHVIELKNVEPTLSLAALAQGFQTEVQAANRALAPFAAQLMPGGMHPWMDPLAETVLWTHDGRDIYAAYDRIFDCRRHGFANLQSMHINLPFADDAQFARLHAAVRLVLPLLPALAASSPFAEGRSTGFLDYRLEVYRTNAGALGTIAGSVVPDTATGRAQYEADVLAPMYREIAPFDPSGTLRYEWLNSRGAIPRFDRNAIEIRLADTQECPHADLAIAAAVVETVRAIFDERWAPLAQQQAIPTATLAEIFLQTIRDAGSALISDYDLLQALGVRRRRCTASELWAHWLDGLGSNQAAVGDSGAWWRPAVELMLKEGTLAQRLLRALRGRHQRASLHRVYATLCQCLDQGRMFR